MSEENLTTTKFNFRRIALIIILINCIILIPLVSVIIADVGGNAVWIATIVFFGTLIAISFTAIIYDIVNLLKKRMNRVKNIE